MRIPNARRTRNRSTMKQPIKIRRAEPLVPAMHEAAMHRVPDIEFQIFGAFPDRQIVNLARVAMPVSREPPGADLGNRIHRIQSVRAIAGSSRPHRCGDRLQGDVRPDENRRAGLWSLILSCGGRLLRSMNGVIFRLFADNEPQHHNQASSLRLLFLEGIAVDPAHRDRSRWRACRDHRR